MLDVHQCYVCFKYNLWTGVVCFVFWEGVSVVMRYEGWCVCVFFFFFQAEDGIRVAQESRGLGDVFRSQDLVRPGDHKIICF